MITIICCIVFFIFKKFSTNRANYLEELAKEKEPKHCESAIFEEQSAIIDDKIDQEDMKIDLTQYFEYQKYDPELLWEDYLKKKPASYVHAMRAEEESKAAAELQVQIYYQTFVHLFRMHIHTLSHMNIFKTNETKSIKLKLIIRKASRDVFTDSTNTYDFDGEVIEFKDKFSFPIKYKELHEYFIYVSVWSVNVFYHENLLGAAHIDLSNYSDYTTKQIVSSDIVPVKKVSCKEKVLNFIIITYLLLQTNKNNSRLEFPFKEFLTLHHRRKKEATSTTTLVSDGDISKQMFYLL